MGSFNSKTKPLKTTFDSLDTKLPPLHRKISKSKTARSLYKEDDKQIRLDIIKSRLKRRPRDDFTIPKLPSVVAHPTNMDILTRSMHDLSVSGTNISRLLKPDSEWGTYQHDPTTLPFKNFIPGIIMDLETCYTNDVGFQINKMKSYIQQIGACGIGLDIENFDVACLLPEKFAKKNTVLPIPTSEESFIAILNMMEQQPELSISGYKKVIGKRDISTEDFLSIYNASVMFWRDNTISKYHNPLQIIKFWKNVFNKKHPGMPLLFRCEDALKMFAEYTRQCPVWYAHNGHGFDYIIMEKWFRIFDIPMTCVCDVYAPRTTTSMQYLRTRERGPNYSIYDIHSNQIGRAPWKVNGQKIMCYDTMKLIKSDKRSLLKKGGRRVSQMGLKRKEYIKTGIDTKAKEKLFYIWNDGSKTSSLFSHKQQDLLEAVGIKANDSSAHTALYDCLTLRELIYRAFNTNTAQSVRKKLNHLGLK